MLSQVEGRKRYEFLEALVVSMDGHLRYFKRGYEVPLKLFSSMHPCNDVLSSHHWLLLNHPGYYSNCVLSSFWGG